MKIEERHFYDIPSIDLFNLFTSKEYIVARCNAPDVMDYSIDYFGEKEGRFVVSVTAEILVVMPDKIPKILQNMMSDRHTMKSVTEWELGEGDARLAHYRVAMSGVPAKISGTIGIKPHETGCLNELDLTIKSSVPLVGKKLCQFIGTEMKTGMADEHQLALEYIENVYLAGQKQA
ncbi:MAG: DUF2505 domain-containing protein [Pseudomonadales bacterium]|nr:DUF2505 domain-containing protein [Pseudomonadales bacterium]